jgi:hypothetical protein
MTDRADWHWGISNAGADKVLLWLEPWADEIEVPSGVTATLRLLNPAQQNSILDVEQTDRAVSSYGLLEEIA